MKKKDEKRSSYIKQEINEEKRKINACVNGQI